MTTLEQARRKFQERLNDYERKRRTRFAVLGDGRGQSTSNIHVPSASDFVWARETEESTRFFPVLNRAAVTPTFNMAVVIGYSDIEPEQEQILGLHYAGLGSIPSASLAPIGPHHQQHEFGGGDTVHIDGLQFRPGLISPTEPNSMALHVQAFNYYWDQWRRFPGSDTADLTPYRPADNEALYLLVALDPKIESLVYRAGQIFSTSEDPLDEDGNFEFSRVPAPSGDEIPIGYAIIFGTQTELGWGSVNNRIGDGRLLLGFPARNILDRLEQLEGLSGNPPNVATTGAAASTVTPLNRTLGGLVDVAVDGVVNGETIVFQQSTRRWVPGTATGGTGVALDFSAPQPVGASNVGSSASAAHGDHSHQGIFSVNVIGNVPISGTAFFVSGAGASISQSGASITLAASVTGNELNFGGNPVDIGSASVVGIGSSAARSDHVHRGLLSLNVPNNNPIFGPVQLVSGTNISLSQTNSSVIINSAASVQGLVITNAGPSDISGASVVGTSASAARGDHVHRGVQSVNVPGNAQLYGPVYIQSGTGTTVTQSGNSVLISASGGGGGSLTLSDNVNGIFELSANHLSLDTQNAIVFFAGPSAGTAQPAFRGIATNDLGTGTANSTVFLRGDLTWQVPATTAVMARAHIESTSGFEADVDTILNFSTVDFDTASGITTGVNWKYTVPSTGFYRVGVSLAVRGILALDSQMRVALTVNGTEYSNLFFDQTKFTDGNTLAAHVHGQDLVNVAGGAELSTFINYEANASLFNTTPFANYITIEKVG